MTKKNGKQLNHVLVIKDWIQTTRYLRKMLLTNLYYEQVSNQYYEKFKFKGRSGKPSNYFRSYSQKIIFLPKYWQDFKKLWKQVKKTFPIRVMLSIDDFKITSVGDIPAHMLT